MAYSGLTPTAVLRYINRELGALMHEIEIDQEGIMRIVYQQTLPLFSRYFPYLYKIKLQPEDAIAGKLNRYRIPRSDRLEIIGISRGYISNLTQFGTSVVPLTNNPFAGQMFEDAMSMIVTPNTFKYVPPYDVEIFPKLVIRSLATLEVKAVHPTHLKTVPMNMRDEFLQMALLDVLVSLYPLRHRFENLTTPYGQILPFFDMVDRAGEEREQLQEKWRVNSLKTGLRQRMIIA